jgi:predicted transcriptional regulator
MVKTTVYLDAEDARTLRTLSERCAKSQSQLVREAIHEFTATRRRPLPGGLGMFDSGRTDTTAHRKEILKDAALTGTWRAKTH